MIKSLFVVININVRCQSTMFTRAFRFCSKWKPLLTASLPDLNIFSTLGFLSTSLNQYISLSFMTNTIIEIEVDENDRYLDKHFKIMNPAQFT